MTYENKIEEINKAVLSADMFGYLSPAHSNTLVEIKMMSFGWVYYDAENLKCLRLTQSGLKVLHALRGQEPKPTKLEFLMGSL